MKIWKHIDPQHIVLDAPSGQKHAVLRFVADRFAENGILADPASFLAGLLEREAVMSTGIGGGIAIPHAVGEDVTRGVVMLMRLEAAVDFEAIDGVPVDLILGLALPAGDTGLHLRLLAGISRLCKNPEFLNAVRTARNSQTLFSTLKALEESMPFH